VVRLAPDEVEMFAQRGYRALRKNELDQAIADFTEAIRRNPKLGIAYARRAETFASKGDLIQASADLVEALQLDPNGAETYLANSTVSSGS